MAKALKMVFKLSDTQTATVLVVKGVNPKAIKAVYIRSSEDQELA